MLVPRSLDDHGIITKPEEEEDKAFYVCIVQGESTSTTFTMIKIA